MNAIQKLRYKTRIGILLGALLALLLLNNIAGQESFAKMQREATSMYQDRLMPSTFLFEIREILYQERIAMSSTAHPEAMDGSLNIHRAKISELLGRFEKTVLTSEEKKEWLELKKNLSEFHSSNTWTLASGTQFEEAINGLNRLVEIQAGEGANLQKELSRISMASTFRGYAELALLIIIGGITLSLIGFSKEVFEKVVSHRPSLN
jgi:hypothetical protein